jgi:hypothetical protein
MTKPMRHFFAGVNIRLRSAINGPDRANSRSGSSRSYVKFVNPSKVEISVSKLIELDVIIQRAGPPIGHPSRRLRAIPRDNLVGQIDKDAQARSHVAASWVIDAISGIRGRPLL